uniref:Uncharacterized protein n=1 Tax=Anguilla anguilla TaxID=7936 RepID=A0A0E9RA72_ANGAN
MSFNYTFRYSIPLAGGIVALG